MEHSEIINHLDDLADWMLDRGIHPADGVTLCTVAIASIINATCDTTHDRARCMNTVIKLLANRTGVNLRTRHLAPDDTDKVLN